MQVIFSWLSLCFGRGADSFVGMSVRRLGSLSLSGNHLEWLPRDVFQPMQGLKQARV